ALLETHHRLLALHCHQYQLHFFEYGRRESAALQVFVYHELVMGTERIDGNLLAEEVTWPLDRAPAHHIEAGPAVLVGATASYDGLDRRAGSNELLDRPIDSSAEFGCVGHPGLNIL